MAGPVETLVVLSDENGNIVGVVVAQLNKLKVAKAPGRIPN